MTASEFAMVVLGYHRRQAVRRLLRFGKGGNYDEPGEIQEEGWNGEMNSPAFFEIQADDPQEAMRFYGREFDATSQTILDNGAQVALAKFYGSTGEHVWNISGGPRCEIIAGPRHRQYGWQASLRESGGE
jgi:hypothetical protein